MRRTADDNSRDRYITSTNTCIIWVVLNNIKRFIARGGAHIIASVFVSASAPLREFYTIIFRTTAEVSRTLDVVYSFSTIRFKMNFEQKKKRLVLIIPL